MAELARPNDSDALLARRMARIRGIYLGSPQATAVYEYLHSFRHHGFRRKGAMCCLLLGPTGSGKSSIFDRYADRPDAQPDPETGFMPVISFYVPGKPSEGDVYDALLNAVGAGPMAGRHSNGTKKIRIAHYLKERRTELLLVHDVQHIIDRRTRTAQIGYWFADMVKKDILEDAQVRVAFNGTLDGRAVVEGNVQLQMRRDEIMYLEAFDVASKNGIAKFRFVVEAFIKAADFASVDPDVLTDGTIERLGAATGAVYGGIYKLIRKTVDIGTRRGAACLDVQLLAEAHAAISDPSDGWENVLTVPKYAKGRLPDESRVTTLHRRDVADVPSA